jgi:hypothetical protein
MVMLGAIVLAVGLAMRHVNRHAAGQVAVLGLGMAAAGMAFGLLVLLVFALTRAVTAARARPAGPDAKRPRGAGVRPRSGQVLNPTVYSPGGLLGAPRDSRAQPSAAAADRPPWPAEAQPQWSGGSPEMTAADAGGMPHTYGIRQPPRQAQAAAPPRQAQAAAPPRPAQAAAPPRAAPRSAPPMPPRERTPPPASAPWRQTDPPRHSAPPWQAFRPQGPVPSRGPVPSQGPVPQGPVPHGPVSQGSVPHGHVPPREDGRPREATPPGGTMPPAGTQRPPAPAPPTFPTPAADEAAASVFVYRDTGGEPDEVATGPQVPPPGDSDAADWYAPVQEASAPAREEQTERDDKPPEVRGPFEPLVFSASDATTETAAEEGMAESDAGAGPQDVAEEEDPARERELKLEQLRDLYLTAEAIGEENVDKHFDKLMAQQRSLISDYFKQSGTGQDGADVAPETPRS